MIDREKEDGGAEDRRSDKIRREDFVPVVVNSEAHDSADGERRARNRSNDERRGASRGRRFDPDNSSPIEVEIGGATVRVLPRTDRVLLNIVFDALRGRR